MSKASVDTLEKITAEFEGGALADLQDGRRQSIALVEAAKRETREEATKILETSVKQAESLKRQIVGAAELEARNAQLKVLEKAVNDAVAEAVAGFSKLDARRYEEALGRLISEGVEIMGSKASVSCSSRDQSKVASVMKEIAKRHQGLTSGEANLETVGGVVLTTPDGAIRFDNTFEARLERLRPILRKEVADLLSG